MTHLVFTNPKDASHITHAGKFHSDEVMATAIFVLKARKDNTEVKLARVSEVGDNVSPEAIIYDIGYGELDHHQQGGNGSRLNDVPYSSCGLVWEKWGRELVSSEQVWSAVDFSLIQGIDAIDNGDYPRTDYPTTAADIASLIASFNPNWDDANQDFDDAFAKAVIFALGILEREIKSQESRFAGEEIVNAAIEKSDGKIIIMEKFAPWLDTVLSSDNPKAASASFMIFPSLRGGWMLQAIPSDPRDRFSMRKSLPARLGGLRGEELVKITDISDATFVHPGLFCGGADSLSGTIALAELSLDS